jgi:two-component system sensor histidine kinase AlgZ
VLQAAVPGFAWQRVDSQLPFVFAIGVLLYLLALAVHYAFIALERAREADRHRLELEVLTREAELRALRAQVDPHFLYNSLNSISALTTTDPAGARRMCLLLGEFLRDTLRVSSRSKIPLGVELGLADHFLAIEHVRFGDRLRVERHVDQDAIACAVPPLILQPLVENAITHGIAGLLEGGVVRLDVARADGRVRIAIENPRDTSSTERRSLGFGIDNVRDRLSTMFAGAARLNIQSEPARFRVEIDLPWSSDE